MPSGTEVADRAKQYSQNDYDWGIGYCLKFSRTSAGAPGLYNDAYTAWKNAQYRHSTSSTPPRGALVFWAGGSRGFGHVAVSDGRGYVWSTDILRPGKVDRVSIAYIGAKWSSQTLLGWTEDVNKVRVTGLEAAPVPMVSLANLKPGVRDQDVSDLQLALRRHGVGSLNPSGATGYFGAETKAMVKEFQSRQGWAGGDADGIPGPKTCGLLGLHVL